MTNPFDYIKSIQNKEYMEDVSGYNHYITNIFFSADPNFAGLANVLNNEGSNELSKRALYDFYYYIIPKGKKWVKFPKKNHDYTTVRAIMEYYEVNEIEAKQCLKVLPKEIISKILKIQGEINGKKTKKN